MKRHVKFLLESGVVSCGVKTGGNFLRSSEVINGGVLRAAFAKDILLDCPFAEEPVNGRKFFVSYRGEKCGSCPRADICKSFSDMSFSFMFPENTMPAPLTSKTCRAEGTAHGVIDTVMENGLLACPECGQRMSDLKGLINRDDFSSVKVGRYISVHSSLNSKNCAAMLFTVDAIAAGCVYEADIDDCGSGLAETGKVIYLGKYSSSGFGKMRIISVEDIPQEESLSARLEKFGRRFPPKDGRSFASLLFLSDAKLDIPSCGTPMTAEEYKSVWQERLFGSDAPVKTEQVCAHNFIYNGFDTSLEHGGTPNKTDILTAMGSSVRISFDSGDSSAMSFLEKLERRGIGRDLLNGYGRVSVCSRIHMKGVKNAEEAAGYALQ